MLSLVIPVYRNELSIPELLHSLVELRGKVRDELEVVFVDDGSPDQSRHILVESLPASGLRATVVTLSRNFGSFAAIRAGLATGQGDYFAVIAADLQEPPSLVARFHELLSSGTLDVVVGTRDHRADPMATRIASTVFWRLYRLLVQPEVPRGGVDVFGCTRMFRDRLLKLDERNSTLVGLIFWLGGRRAEVGYARLARRHGASAWSLSRRLRYLMDSAFAFSDLPIRLLSVTGLLGMTVALTLAAVVLLVKLSGGVDVPGYTATVLVVMFFGGLNSFGLGVIGEYLWRTFENTKQRPEYVVLHTQGFDPR